MDCLETEKVTDFLTLVQGLVRTDSCKCACVVDLVQANLSQIFQLLAGALPHRKGLITEGSEPCLTRFYFGWHCLSPDRLEGDGLVRFPVQSPCYEVHFCSKIHSCLCQFCLLVPCVLLSLPVTSHLSSFENRSLSIVWCYLFVPHFLSMVLSILPSRFAAKYWCRIR